MKDLYSRRRFVQGGAAAAGWMAVPAFGAVDVVKVSAHLWIYAAMHPPTNDSTPELERAFRDLQGSGFAGVELMAQNLRHDDAVERIHALTVKYGLPVTGCTFSAAMWDTAQHDAILKDAETVIARLAGLGGVTLGCTVGDAKRTKTDADFDAQVAVLRAIEVMGRPHGIVVNLHNHIYELADGMHDLKGTLARLPEVKLGPDLNWMIRAGVDPVAFIDTYCEQMVYMHLRDQDASGVWTETLGQGATDFGRIAAALKRTHYKGRAAVELAFPPNFKPDRPLGEVWKLSRQYVKTTFGW